MASPQFPLVIYGKVTSNKTRIVGNIQVNIKNVRTGESLQVTSEPNGEYAGDLANMTQAYIIGDTVVVSVFNTQPVFDDNINIDNGKIELK